MAEAYLTSVRDQYEDLPYPPRDPKAEQNELQVRFMDALDQVNYYCFGGKIPLGKDFRVLIAGGGTGDATIYLAEQLKAYGGEVVQVDLSDASLAIAQQRAAERKLDNVSLIQDSLLNLTKLDIGPFDYIDCVGVLHHLEDPSAGLQQLKAVLKDDGAMGIMVYGEYGRTGVYHMQKMLRLMNGGDDGNQTKIDRAKKLVGTLPASNWFKKDEAAGGDHLTFGDSGVFDLFLHSQDRAYTVPQLYEWMAENALHLQNFSREEGMGKHLYAPDLHVKDPALLQHIKTLDIPTQQAFTELFLGSIHKIHSFYVTKQPRALPAVDDWEMVPAFSVYFYDDDMYGLVHKMVCDNPNKQVKIGTRSNQITFTKTPNSDAILRAVDGKRSLRELFAASGMQGEAAFLREFKQLFDAFNFFDWMFLRHKDVPQFLDPNQLQAQMKERSNA